VRIIVGFPPGGPTDIFARLIAEWLSNQLGQAFIVENRPGAGSTIGIAAVITAPADGYTLLLVSTSAVISAAYYRNLSFNLVRDITPVCGIALEPLVMVVHPSVLAHTVPEFIAYAKTNPGKIIMASVGNGTTPQMTGELFKMMAGVDLLHVPYQGAAPALTDLLAGRAQVMFEAMPSLVGYIQSGKLRALGVSTATRSLVFPESPRSASLCQAMRQAFGLASRRADRRQSRSSNCLIRRLTRDSVTLRSIRGSASSVAQPSRARPVSLKDYLQEMPRSGLK
jgi:tripartite-type tricarboxylate transporter receptor subunit TctC